MKVTIAKKKVTMKKKPTPMPFKPSMGAKLAGTMSKNMSV